MPEALTTDAEDNSALLYTHKKTVEAVRKGAEDSSKEALDLHGEEEGRLSWISSDRAPRGATESPGRSSMERPPRSSTLPPSSRSGQRRAGSITPRRSNEWKGVVAEGQALRKEPSEAGLMDIYRYFQLKICLLGGVMEVVIVSLGAPGSSSLTCFDSRNMMCRVV